MLATAAAALALAAAPALSRAVSDAVYDAPISRRAHPLAGAPTATPDVVAACPCGIDLLGGDRSCRAGPHIAPAYRAGRPIGFRLFGLRAELEALGFRQGDLVTGIRGCAPLTTPEAALDCYARLRSAARVDVELERAGVRHTLFVRAGPRCAWLAGSATEGGLQVEPTDSAWELLGIAWHKDPAQRAAVLRDRGTLKSLTVARGHPLGSGEVVSITRCWVAIRHAGWLELVTPPEGHPPWVEQRRSAAGR